MKLSAYSLTRREACERRFVLETVERLRWPSTDADQGDAARLGQDFHRLVHRHRLGIPVQPIGQLARLWEAFLASPYAEPGEASWSEQVLQFSLAGREGEPVPFMVRFDEVRREADGTWTILDWKTGSLRSDGLEDLWQSRLYRFALATAGHALDGGKHPHPGDIKLVYWLVSTGRGLVLPYDRARFEADRLALESVARQVATRLDEAGGPAAPRACSSCPYDPFCNTPVLPTPPAPPLILPSFTR